MTRRKGKKPEWLHEIEPEQQPSRSGVEQALEQVLDTAWNELLRQHMPFLVAEEARVRLADVLRSIERLFYDSDNENLAAYYAQAFRAKEASVELTSNVRHVAMLQVHLMEQAFFVLQLNRYANAPSNRGWMNLFRRWGSSDVFNTVINEARTTCSHQFIHFYDNFVRYYGKSIDEMPVRHPWDPPLLPWRPKLPLDDVERERKDELSFLKMYQAPDVFAIPGVFLDSGIVETSDGTSDPSDAPAAPGGLSGMDSDIASTTEEQHGTSTDAPNA